MIEDIRLFLEPQLGFLAKSNGEPLWLHHFLVYKVCMRLKDMLPTFPEMLINPLKLACLTHDIGKMNKKAQEVLSGELKGARVKHKLEYEDLRSYVLSAKGLVCQPSEEDIKAAYDIAVTHHSVTDDDIIRSSTAYANTAALLLRVSDWIASMEVIDAQTLERINAMFTMPGRDKPLLNVTYFEIGRDPSPSTSLIAENTLEAFEKMGYQRLILFPNAAVVAKSGPPSYPCRKDIAKGALENIAKESIKNIPPEYGTKKLMIGSIAEMPDEYLLTHKEKILRDLSSSENGAVAFFKILAELISLIGFGPNNKDIPWQLRVIHRFTSGNVGIPLAQKEWEKDTGVLLPKQENGKVDRRQALKVIADHLRPSDIVTDDMASKIGDDFQKVIYRTNSLEISRIKPDDQFDLLLWLARGAKERKSSEHDRCSELAALISYPVETDFVTLARERFVAYKRYKKTPKPEDGVCEICGSAFTQKPGTEAPDKSIQCFSYVKSKPTTPRAICFLCAYDLSLIRKDVSLKDVSVTLWITSRVDPEIEVDIEEVIDRMKSSFKNPRRLTRMLALKEGLGIPLPEFLKVPLSEDAADTSNKPQNPSRFMKSPFGILAFLESVPMKRFSVKNFKATYAPLYDILQMLGFHVCMTNDIEFRDGLFGEVRLSSYTSYLDAVSTLLLAKTLSPAKRNPQCMAADIIAKQPSIAITRGLDVDDQGRPLLSQEQMEYYFRSLLRADRPILKGGMTMGLLLKDAAFFAQNIPSYCVDPEDRLDFWKKLTKHKATKPVQSALNEMMHGHDFDIAMARFLSYLSEKIGKEEREAMDKFVRESEVILRRYFELRQNSFSDFLKAKNALMNGIYTFTRYKGLSEIFEE